MVKKKSILLVDDELIILKSIAKDLKTKGYSVTTAENGINAIAKLQMRPYDLVITDFMMEGMDGIQVLKQAKKLYPEIPVIILTGYGDLTSAIDALRLGADDYLLKPCSINELLFRISRAEERYELRKKINLYENILPICSVCRKIRDDAGKEPGSGEWFSIEDYLARKTGILMSHGYCKECYEKTLEEFSSKNKNKGEGQTLK